MKVGRCLEGATGDNPLGDQRCHRGAGASRDLTAEQCLDDRYTYINEIDGREQYDS